MACIVISFRQEGSQSRKVVKSKYINDMPQEASTTENTRFERNVSSDSMMSRCSQDGTCKYSPSKKVKAI